MIFFFLNKYISSFFRPRISVDQQHFEEAFTKVRPSVDTRDQNKYKLMEKKYSNPNKAKPVTETAAESANIASAFTDPWEANTNQSPQTNVDNTTSDTVNSNDNNVIAEDMEVADDSNKSELKDSAAQALVEKPSDNSAEKSKDATEKSGKIYNKDLEKKDGGDDISVEEAFKQNTTEQGWFKINNQCISVLILLHFLKF